MGKFERNPYVELPDGTVAKVYPFHISLEGLESRILCRDDQDCDAFVKIIAVTCRRKNVILVMYAVVSNHAHAVVLAAGQDEADACAEEIKRMISMYFSGKYGSASAMKGVDAQALWIDSDWYLRNAIAYDIRNALDNGATNLDSYPWTGYKALFSTKKGNAGCRPVRVLTKREKRRIFLTNDKLCGVNWLLDGNNELVPSSICCWRYAESAFQNDQAFFFKTIGTVNTAEMQEILIVSPRSRRPDAEFLCYVNEISNRWFKTDVHGLSREKKAKLISYVDHSVRTNPAQLARCFELERSTVLIMLGKQKE